MTLRDLALIAIATTTLAMAPSSIAQEAAPPVLASEPRLDLTGVPPTDERYLFEVMRHLYRWYLDEGDVRPEINRGEFLFWVRALSPMLDPGDESEYIEIILPRLDLTVRAKKAHYDIPELELQVRSPTYMITSVRRGGAAKTKPAEATEVTAAYESMRDRLTRTKDLLKPPTDALLDRMRVVARRQFAEYLREQEVEFPEGSQIIHLGPLSPGANEAWVYWEGGRMLLRFSADLPLEDPDCWKHEELLVDFYSLDRQVVVSLDEVAGSNAYLTRDEVGRVLFNCQVFGRRVELSDPENP